MKTVVAVIGAVHEDSAEPPRLHAVHGGLENEDLFEVVVFKVIVSRGPSIDDIGTMAQCRNDPVPPCPKL